MWETIAWSGGLALQLAGAVIALQGLSATHREYKRSDEPGMWEWLFVPGRWLGAKLRRLWVWVLAVVFRNQRDATIRTRWASASASGAPLTSVKAQVIHAAIDASLSTDERIRILDDRLRAAEMAAYRVEDELSAERERVDNLSSALTAEVEGARQEWATSLAGLATRGLRKAAFGLVLTIGGMILSATADLPWTHTH